MQPETEKAKPRLASPPRTAEPEAHKAQNFTARMHFYAVHNAGEQLRHSGRARARVGREHNRMERR